MIEQMHQLIEGLDASDIERIKSDPEVLTLWRDLGNMFFECCIRMGTTNQDELIALQETLQRI